MWEFIAYFLQTFYKTMKFDKRTGVSNWASVESWQVITYSEAFCPRLTKWKLAKKPYYTNQSFEKVFVASTTRSPKNSTPFRLVIYSKKRK